MVFPSAFEEKIGFDRIRRMISENCLCQLGREQVDSMQMMSEPGTIEHELKLTDELRQILLMEENFPQDNYLDPTPALKKLDSKGSFLEIQELFILRKSISTLKSLHRFFTEDKIKAGYPALAGEFKQLKVFPYIGERIDSILTKEGNIKDSASAELRKIRDSKKQKQSAVTRKIQSILKNLRHDGIVDTDADVTLRDGRPVIPVPAGNKRSIGGLIHDESSSGKTVFIEPSEVVEINNEIRELEYAERREILKILMLISDDLRPYADELLLTYMLLGRVDFLRAKAKLAIRIGGVKPILSKEDTLQWKNAVHPLLLLAHETEKKEVVPLDIRIDSINRILLISGPNAGGKSVCLKTVGLLQYMIQCGIPAPMSENSETTVFQQIFIDIGDEQSLENDLSTYSSHLLNMKRFLRTANKDSLILIDEFGTGTEPALGGAIAEAILEELNRKEIYGVITTHYANLKHFASETPGLVNGAMLFDTEQIRPLFRLSIGEPGSSFAIEIARKIGLPEEIVKLAAQKVGSDYINFEKHLREIIRDKKYWEEKRQRIRRIEKSLDDLYLNYSNELESLQKDRKKILQEAKEEAKSILKEANRNVEKTIREIREHNADKEKTRTTRKTLEDYRGRLEKDEMKSDIFDKKLEDLQNAGRKLAEKSPVIETARVSQKKKKAHEEKAIGTGDYVRMKGLDPIGEVLEVAGKNVVVAFGNMITSLTVDKLELAEQDQATRKISGSMTTDSVKSRRLNFKPEIDVRGKRADEALAVVQDFIDDAVMVSVKQLRILHGKGNGVLRTLIQDYLRSLPEIKTVKDAHVEQGGTGITLVELDF